MIRLADVRYSLRLWKRHPTLVAVAGLSLGLTRVGLPAETAFAIALTYRFATFYLPPIWGFMSYKWMTSRRYL